MSLADHVNKRVCMRKTKNKLTYEIEKCKIKNKTNFQLLLVKRITNNTGLHLLQVYREIYTVFHNINQNSENSVTWLPDGQHYVFSHCMLYELKHVLQFLHAQSKKT